MKPKTGAATAASLVPLLHYHYVCPLNFARAIIICSNSSQSHNYNSCSVVVCGARLHWMDGQTPHSAKRNTKVDTPSFSFGALCQFVFPTWYIPSSSSLASAYKAACVLCDQVTVFISFLASLFLCFLRIFLAHSHIIEPTTNYVQFIFLYSHLSVFIRLSSILLWQRL